MKILIIQEFRPDMKPILRQTRQKLESFYGDVTIEAWNYARPNFTEADIKKTEADLLLTFDLAGFGQSTLMGGLTYNLVNCKQIHILLCDNLVNEGCLSKQLSIAMFFYCADAGIYRRLQTSYPDIPYLKEFKGWKQENTSDAANENAEILCNIIQEVAEICHIS